MPQDDQKRSKVAAMAFRRLFDTLPQEAQQQWKVVQAHGNRSETTQWLMDRMKKVDGKWVFELTPHGGQMQKSGTRSSMTSLHSGSRAVPRFRAVFQCGGEQGFQRALSNGELIEVKSSRTGKSLYRWEEEWSDKASSFQNSTSMSQQEQLNAGVFDAMFAGMDFNAMAPFRNQQVQMEDQHFQQGFGGGCGGCGGCMGYGGGQGMGFGCGPFGSGGGQGMGCGFGGGSGGSDIGFGVRPQLAIEDQSPPLHNVLWQKLDEAKASPHFMRSGAL